MTVVTIEHIKKSYPDIGKPALDDVSIEVRKNEILGLIGPDGAGKTTLFRILATLLIPDGGKARILGYDTEKDYKAIRQKIGYMPGRFSLYTDLTVDENLQFFASIYGVTIEENYHIIHDIYTQLEPFKNRRAGKLSGGMKQKLALCCALIHQPEVLLLDEPTTGVDPVSRKEFWDILSHLRTQGMTTLVSTPYMDEAERCDRVALIDQGKVMTVSTSANIIDQFPVPLYGLWSPDLRRALTILRDHELIHTCYSFGDSLHITFHDEPADVVRMVRDLGSAGVTSVRMVPIDPDIEDCFIRLMSQHGA